HKQSYISLVFFFQAEDGIRDRNVTGVQTCALPISTAADTPAMAMSSQSACMSLSRCSCSRAVAADTSLITVHLHGFALSVRTLEIGRASCRERRQESVCVDDVKET